ncbi:MAG: sigma 54-interacting transcriptional regulator [Candidatus Krumholzibacteriota bacterium]
MRPEKVRPGIVARSGDGPLKDLLLDPSTWETAWQAHLKEDYEASLAAARRCLDEVDAGERPPLSLVPDPSAPKLQDAVVLCAKNLFQLERFDDFEVLQASAGKWGMVAEESPELDAVQLAFACKRGDYVLVVDETTRYIDAHRHNLPPVIADFLYLRGLAYTHLGDPDRARDDTEAAYSIFKVLNRDFECARTANLLGVITFKTADYPKAELWFRRALDLHTQLGMFKNMGGNRMNIGIAFYKQGHLGRSLAELDAAARLLKEVDAKVSLCRCAIAQGNTLRLQRHFEAARDRLMTAYEVANQLMLSREEALALEFMGDVCRDEGAIDKARRYYSRALAIGRSIAPDGDIVMEVLRRQGECLEKLGRHSEAVTVLGSALTKTRRQGDRYEEGVVRRVLGENLLGLGDLDSAAHHAVEATRLLRSVGARHELGLAQMTLARARLARLDSGLCQDPATLLDEAWKASMSALDLFLKMEVDHWILAARKLVSLISGRRADLEKTERMIVATDRLHGNRPKHAEAGPIIHVSPGMRDLIQLADAFADSDEPVLITGATGTGKELFARRLHRQSGRRSAELVSVNVSAIPETIFAREFFGHTRGSFSGAERDGIGLAAKADGGTLFLDEIGDLPLELQPQLLRLLQDGTYQAIGDPSQRRTNIRLVAATNADLQKLVAEGKFRADLYYRLKILELKLPPITSRTEDILPLLRHFLTLASGQPVELRDFFDQESLDLMLGYEWPGNVREIAMVARQAKVQVESRGRVQVEVGGGDDRVWCFQGPGNISGATDPGHVQLTVVPGRGPRQHDKMETGRSRILLALAETDGNRAQAARLLGVSRSTLYRQMEKLGIAGKTVTNVTTN